MKPNSQRPALLPRLLVTTSTYPRWRDDPEPGFVHELCKRLTQRFEVTVLCPHARGAKVDEEIDGVCIRRFRYAPHRLETLVNDGGILANLARSPWKWLLMPGFVLGQWLALRRQYRRLQPDIVHCHWLLPQGLVATVAGLKPVVVTSHGADLFALDGRVFRALRAWVSARARAVTVVSEAMRRRLSEETPTARASTMSMGVDMETRFTEGDGKRSPNVILAVGRLVAKKGLIYLIEAMPKICSAYPQARLDIVGFGPELERLQQRARLLGVQTAVRFLGPLPQTELAGHYRSAAVFVAPFIEAPGGDQEGLGLVVAEAIGCSCPVVVGDVPAVHDLIEDSPECIVPQRDAEALAAAVVRVLKDPDGARVRARALRDVVSRKFSWDAVAKRYIDLFESIVSEERRRD